jgi:hypothetical protein
MQHFNPTADFSSHWDREPPAWAVNGELFGTVGDVVWAREVEVKCGHISMLALPCRHRRNCAAGPLPLPVFR